MLAEEDRLVLVTRPNLGELAFRSGWVDEADRLAREGAPFGLRVDASAAGVDVCLSDAHGGRLTCASGPDAAAALAAFHSAAFSSKVSLAESDLGSLDGNPVRVDADEPLKKVLGN